MQFRSVSEYEMVVSHAGLHSSNALRAGLSDVVSDNPRLISLPVGWQGRPCPNCRSGNLRGALISPSADEQDPDVLCTACGLYL